MQGGNALIMSAFLCARDGRIKLLYAPAGTGSASVVDSF